MQLRFTFCLIIAVNSLVTGGSCKKDKDTPPAPRTRDSVNTPPPVSYGNGTAFLALGDSYTIGASVNPEERFPQQIKDILTAAGKNIPVLRYIAVSGWTTSNLQNAIQQENPPDSFGIVTLLIGVNDQYRGMGLSGYRERFKVLLEKSIQLAGNRKNRVFVLSIPDYSVTPFAKWSDTEKIREEIDAFNSANKEITESYNVSYTDITTISREALNDASLLATDGLHPSGKMYRRWAELLAFKIDVALK